MRFTIAATATAALLALTACGGGGGEGEQTNAQNDYQALEANDANMMNGAVPDQLEGNSAAERRNLKTGEPAPAISANASGNATATQPPEAPDSGEVESNVSGM